MKPRTRHPVVGMLASVALAVGPATAQDIYYSLQGQFADGGDRQELFFDVGAGIASFEDVRIRTYHHGGTLGGTNLAGDVIPAGGFDPTLRLEEGDGTFVAFNDNIIAAFLLDAQIVEGGLPDEGNTYRTDLEAAGGDLGGLDNGWALDLAGDADTQLKLAASDNDSTGSTINSLKFGTTGTGAARVLVSTGQSLVVDGTIVAGHTGNGALGANGSGRITAVDVQLRQHGGLPSTISGIGTELTVSNNLTVGQPENSTLIVINDAVVTVGNQFTIGSGGTLTLTNDGTLITDIFHHTSGGTFSFTDGRLSFNTFNGNLATSSGTVAPGSSPGLSIVNGAYTQGTNATLEIEIGGTDNSDPDNLQFDQLIVNGQADLGGTLKVDLVNLGEGLFVPQEGDSFPFFTGGFTSTFDFLDLPELTNGLAWQLNPGDATIFLNVVAALTGDFDGDGDVDGDDLTDPVDGWEARFGNDLTGANFLAWQQQFGSPGAPPLASSRAVPEPSAVWLCFLTLAVSVFRR